MMRYSEEEGVFFRYEGTDSEVYIPEGIRIIEKGAFSDVASIKKIVLPESLEIIESEAFFRCPYIGSITIKGNPEIKSKAFEGSGIREFRVGRSETYSVIEGVLFNYDKTELLAYPARKRAAEYKVPEGVTRINRDAFCGDNGYLFIVYLPRSIQEILNTEIESCYFDEYEAIRGYGKYFSQGLDHDENWYVLDSWHDYHFAFYNCDLIHDLGSGIYLGGPLDDIPAGYKEDVTFEFLYAMQAGITEIEKYKDSYFDYIKENENKFAEELGTFSFELMLREKLLSKKLVAELLCHPYLKQKRKLKKTMLEYVGDYELQSNDPNSTDEISHNDSTKDDFVLGETLWILSNAGMDGQSRIEFKTDKKTAIKASNAFQTVFRKKWDNEIRKLTSACEEDVNDFIEEFWYYRNPISVILVEEGFNITISPLNLLCDENGTLALNGDCILTSTIDWFRKEYPDMKFDGYVGYPFSNRQYGEITEFSVSSEFGCSWRFLRGKLFPSVGEALANAVGEKKFWEELFDDWRLYEGVNYKNVLRVFYNYQSWLPEDVCEKYILLAKEHHVDNCEELENFLSELRSKDRESECVKAN